VGEAENVVLIRQAYERWNATGRLAKELLDPEVEWFNPLDTAGRVLRSPEEVERNLADILDTYEFMRNEPQRIEADGNLVVVVSRTTIRGRGSGIDFVNHAAHVWTVRDRRALRFEVYEDIDEALRLVGVTR
jgi:ketosteroid isomerase-like protein